MANEFIARNGLIAQNSSTVTGSLTVTGGITGSLLGTASYSSQALSSSFASTASFVTLAQTASFVQTAQTASYVAWANVFETTADTFLGTSSYANQALSSSYALTASFALNAGGASSFPFTGSAIISGSLSVIGPTSVTGSLAISGSGTGSIFSVSASYIDFDFDSFLFSGSTTFQGSLDATNATSSFGTVTATNARLTGSIFGSSSYALTASFALNAASGGGFPFTGSAIITGSLTTIGRNTLTGSFTASNSESVDLLNSILFHPAITGSRIYQSTVSPTFRTTGPSQTSTALRVNPTFTGSFTGSNTQNIIVDFGATNVGSQFTVNDITSGSIYMVNDVSGLPIIEATSDWSVNIYDYPNIVFKKTGSLVQISGSLVVTGGGFTGSLFGTASWAQNAVTSSYVLQAVSSSFSTSASYALTASFALNGGGGAAFPFTGSAQITGSLGVTGSLNVTQGVTGSLFGTSSWANNAVTASYISHSIGTEGNDISWTGSLLNIPNASSTARGVITTGTQTIAGNKSFPNPINLGGTTSLNSILAIAGSASNTQIGPGWTQGSLLGVGDVEFKIASTSTSNYVLGAGYVYATHLITSINVTEATSGTSSLVSQLAVKPINLTNGSATTTNAATVFIDGPASGSATITNNYALWINGGTTRLDGNLIVSGSTTITGSLTVNSGITGSLFGTSSWAEKALTASYVTQAISSSFSSTASYLNTLNQDLIFNGNLTLNGTASISYLNISYESASVIYSSGSNQFGDATNDTQTLIGTVIISGSLQTTGSTNIPNLTGSLFGTASWAQNSTTASYVLNAVSSSFATTSSFALTASFALNAGGAVNTGSLLTTASAAGNTITFTKGNGTTFNVSVTGGTNTVYYGSNVSQSFTSQSSWTFNHNLQSQFVIIQALDSNYNQIIPTSITLTGINQATLTFPVSQSGYAIAGLGGNPSSASYALTASYAENAGGSSVKAGEVSSASFGGAPYTASVTFGTAYPNTSYAVVITGEDERIYTVNNKQTTGFTINTNSNVLFSGSVYWQATTYSNS